MVNKVGEITHTHPIPQKWDELVAFSENLLSSDSTLTRTPEMSASMLERLGGLENEELDAHRYYGIGLIMCGVAQALHNTKLHPEIVRSAGERLYEHWLAASSTPNIEPQDINGLVISGIFGHTAVRAGAALPPAVQLLNDALLVSVVDRRLAIKYPNRDVSHLRLGREEDGAIEQGVAARAVGGQVATAASTVLQKVLENRAAFAATRQERVADRADAPSPSAVEIMDEAGPEALALDEVGVRCASVRVDEFRNNLDDYLDVSETGVAIFRRDRMVPAAKLTTPEIIDDQEVVLHTKRLRCPAMFVEDLIPVMFGLTQSIVREADRRAQQRVARYGR